MPACSASGKEADGMEAKSADEMSVVRAMTPGVLVAGSLQGASCPRAAAQVAPVSEGGGDPSPVPPAPPRSGTLSTATSPTGRQDEQCMLPFALRLNLARDSLTGVMNWVSLVVTVAFWLRIEEATLGLHAFLAIEAAVCILGIWWRRRSLGKPLMGSYGRWREVLGITMRLNEALLGAGTGWTVAWLVGVGDAHPGWPPWALAARHSVLLLLASATFAHLLTWAKPLRLSLAVPVHLLLTIAMAQRNHEACASPCLSGPAAERLTHMVFQGMDILRIDVFRGIAPAPSLTPRIECAAVLTHLHATLGFLLPALFQAASESRLFKQHQQERRQRGLPPEHGWQARMYACLTDLWDTLAWPQVLSALGILLSLTFMLSTHPGSS